ncbi:hypothetical protein CB473P2_00119 [Enterocloster phage CB473P2]|nr:hypothetical protein CB457P2_00118 [Enterocloster phage CB457P2]WAX11539.1 hypothetical protein CB473P2_00119 [Enterocloster phage CB473P2]
MKIINADELIADLELRAQKALDGFKKAKYKVEKDTLLEANVNYIKMIGIVENIPTIENGWIETDERLPKQEEWIEFILNKEMHLRKFEIVVYTDEVLEYFFVFYDGYKWFDEFGRIYTKVAAWRIHEPYCPN